MAREVAEQPAALARTLDALRPQRGELAALAEGRRAVLFLARGSSDNAAVYGRYLLGLQKRKGEWRLSSLFYMLNYVASATTTETKNSRLIRNFCPFGTFVSRGRKKIV